MQQRLKKILDKAFSTSAAGLYLILFAGAIGIATFIENDFGTSAAQKVVYRAGWFELLLVLFGITVIVNIFRFRMIQQKKYAILTFHAATIVILLGAAATRYLGSEGLMHIREGEQTNLILSTDTYLQFEVNVDDQVYHFDEKVFFASLGTNHFSEQYQIGNQIIGIELDDFVPNPVEHITPGGKGRAMIKLVMGGSEGRQEFVVKEGDRITIMGIPFNFSERYTSSAVNISSRNDSLFVQSGWPLTQMQMTTRQLDTIIPGSQTPMLLRSLYTTPTGNFVVSEFNPSAETTVSSSSQKMSNKSVGMARLIVSVNEQKGNLDVKGNAGMTGKPETLVLDDISITASYGSRYVALPFSIRLRDFIMDRYPGTNSASSYASEVTLVDDRTSLVRDQRIFMNNILNYGGYRFFQSSYDQDERGTILSVNHDALGTWISYLGYFLLTLGMVLTLFSGKSRFSSLGRKLNQIHISRQTAAVIIPLFLLASIPSSSLAQVLPEQQVIDADHAARVASLVVQDHKGRMKPVHTLASEVLRKLSRKEELYGQSATQIFLGMMVYPEIWTNVPLIKAGGHEELEKLIPVEGKLATYNNFFNPDYLLRDQARKAFSLEPKDRGTFEKEVIKIDERVNICNLVFAGRFFKVYPTTTGSDTWHSPSDLQHAHNHPVISDPFILGFFEDYAAAVRERDWETANKLVDRLCNYQQEYGGEILPPDKKIKSEILLNKMNVFSRVGRYYGLFGLLTLIMFFTLVFNPKWNPKWPLAIAVGLLGICFLVHTTGLGLRWYVSGRAPWSNGYESMIYIAWTTMLAGLIFTRKSLGGLAATSILASTILMVAGMSWLDPEITPLVPVLKSYWLTIHVSLIAGSYGFLMLGAIIGILNLILMVSQTKTNQVRIKNVVREMSYISEMTLIGGLFMISIGTYLGGIWANESWGRYWGWDAKETWALVTILIYAFILHMRFIPGLKSLYAFNVATLFGLASVMMTYFGVNYYLSGLHSYAAGDPAPIPPFVFYTVASLFILSMVAYWRNKQLSSKIVGT
ncbi:MAG: cytochrome c biogenesis protein CcsA [Saprospiraceae bacterium]|nr:cytochrome c biogenesis protein CcsA [Saprospiraceae bacterium]